MSINEFAVMSNPIERRLLAQEVVFKDAYSSVHSCLHTYWGAMGHHGGIDRLLARLPIPVLPLTATALMSRLRGMGMHLREACAVAPCSQWFLAIYAPNYAVLIFQASESQFYVAVPGQSKRVIARSEVSTILSHARLFFEIVSSAPGRFYVPAGQPVMWCIPYEPAYLPRGHAAASKNDPGDERVRYRGHPNLTLDSISHEEFKRLHCALAPQPGQLGAYRDRELQRGGSWFVASAHIAHAMEALIMFSTTAASSMEAGVKQSVMIFVDFLTIHPFRNGNGRIAKILLTYLCRDIGALNWKNISRSELYYWVSQAQHGDISYLLAGIMHNIQLCDTMGVN